MLHCLFDGERMHLVIGRSFHFTAQHFGTATDPFEFVRVASHSSVLKTLVICGHQHHIFACRNRSNYWPVYRTTVGDKLMGLVLVPIKHFCFGGDKFNFCKGEVSLYKEVWYLDVRTHPITILTNCIPDAKRGYYGFIIVVVRVRVRRDFLLATYSPHFFPDFFHIWQVT